MDSGKGFFAIQQLKAQQGSKELFELARVYRSEMFPLKSPGDRPRRQALRPKQKLQQVAGGLGVGGAWWEL